MIFMPPFASKRHLNYDLGVANVLLAAFSVPSLSLTPYADLVRTCHKNRSLLQPCFKAVWENLDVYVWCLREYILCSVSLCSKYVHFVLDYGMILHIHNCLDILPQLYYLFYMG
ncbi:hypothetical protein Ancab_004404 [Ancistrocladus abbreviatus]